MDNESIDIAEKANNVCKNLKSLHEELLGYQNIQELEESNELSNKLGRWDGFAPDTVNVNNVDDFFIEMAEIYPHYNDDYNIKANIRFRMSVVEGGEGPVPHVHIYYEHKGDKNHGKIKTVAYVCLGTNEYAPQHVKETKILNSKERKALKAFFDTKVPKRYGKDKNDNVFQLTCWQDAVVLWENLYGKQYGMEQYFEVDEETGLYIMPDYTEINLPKKDGIKTESVLEDDILDQEVDSPITLEEAKSPFKVGDVVSVSWSEDLYVITETVEADGGEFRYDMTSLGEYPIKVLIDHKEALLEFQYHDANYEKYFTESVENGLPAWRGKLYNFYMFYKDPETHGSLHEDLVEEYNDHTIPPRFMEHILESHSIYDRIDEVLRSNENRDKLMQLLHVDKGDLKDIKDSIHRKINARNLNELSLKDQGRIIKKPKTLVFTEQELAFVDGICKLDVKKDHYPLGMTNLQIMDAIREAYENAYKTNTRRMQRNNDRRTGEESSPKRGQRLYRGESSKYGLTIEFWFNLDMNVIESAYPIKINKK